MPKMLCSCGEVIPMGVIPCPHELLLISAVDLERFPDQIDWSALYKEMTSTMVCPRCKCLWVFWNGFGEPPTQYQKESSSEEQ